MSSPLPISDIRAFPTDTGAVIDKHPEFDIEKLHESLFRSFQILLRVKWLLAEGASVRVVQQEISEMEAPNMPNQEQTREALP